jgi:hypothetical protein
MSYNLNNPKYNKVDEVGDIIDKIVFILKDNSLITDEIAIAYEKELNDPNYDHFAKYKEYYKIDPKRKVLHVYNSICLGFKISENIIDIERNFPYKYRFNILNLLKDVFKKNKYDIHMRHMYEYYGSGDNIDIKYIKLSDFIEGNLSEYFRLKNKRYEFIREFDKE